MKTIQRSLVVVCGLFISKLALSQDTSTVYFDFDRYDLRPGSVASLQQIASKPKLQTIKIFGHTDQLGTGRYNDLLSQKRANTVRDFLIGIGVDESSISLVQGFGEAQPVLTQLDAVSRQANRRVVVIAAYGAGTKDSIIVDHSSNTATPNRSGIRKSVKKDLITEITDSSTREGDNLVLPNINFYGGRHIFLPEAYTALHQLLNAMRTIATLEIEIQGHICCQEGDGDGLDIDTGQPILSHNRARAVYEYLADNGIDRSRMAFRGFGHRFPIIATEETEEERTTNRRVEIKILKK